MHHPGIIEPGHGPVDLARGTTGREIPILVAYADTTAAAVRYVLLRD